jgi:predicted ATPase
VQVEILYKRTSTYHINRASSKLKQHQASQASHFFSTIMSTVISVAVSSVTGEVSSTGGGGGDQWGDATSSSTLYGRTHETLQLLNAYSRVSNDQAYEVVAVHGETGSGKTALVEILRETAFESNGYYVFGKYDQKNSGVQEPYSAIMAAFSDLCYLTIQSVDFEDRRLQIQAALGDDGRLLCKTMPCLAPFLDESLLDDIQIKDEAALNKFTIACKTFLLAISSLEHPIVLVLDDIQWMDEGSRHIMSALLSDNDMKNVLLIIIYRDEEQEAALDLLGNASKKYTEIYVGSLTVDGIQEMITSRLNVPLSDEVRELSELVYQRTIVSLRACKIFHLNLWKSSSLLCCF